MIFLELAERVLREEKRPLTANEIWTLAAEKGYDKKLNSEGKTPWAKLGAQIYVNAKDKPKIQREGRIKKLCINIQELVIYKHSLFLQY